MPTVASSNHSLSQYETEIALGGYGSPSKPVWYEIRDEKSKKLFYYNDSTKVTQWERPENVTIVQIEQRGVAIILGNGVIEKDYRNAPLGDSKAASIDNHIYLNAKDHLYDTVRHTQESVFKNQKQESSTTPITDSDMTPDGKQKALERRLTPRDSLALPYSEDSFALYIKRNYILKRSLFRGNTPVYRLQSYKEVTLLAPANPRRPFTNRC